MVAQNLLRDVLSLPVADRVDLFERLRDNLQVDPAALPLSKSQERELDQRYAAFLRHPDEGHSIEEVETMLAARQKA
jgi:putative addiction module component (TIGR02574 family)